MKVSLQECEFEQLDFYDLRVNKGKKTIPLFRFLVEGVGTMKNMWEDLSVHCHLQSPLFFQ